MKKVLDTMGQVCPFPLEEAIHAVQDLEQGDELVIHFDCTQATESIPRWAFKEGLTIKEFTQTGDAAWKIVLEK